MLRNGSEKVCVYTSASQYFQVCTPRARIFLLYSLSVLRNNSTILSIYLICMEIYIKVLMNTMRGKHFFDNF